VGQRPVGQHADVMRSRIGQQAGLDVAAEQVAVHPQAALGSDHHRVPGRPQLGGQRPAEQPFGTAEPAGLRGVEEVDASRPGAADRGHRGLLVHGP
jgi:hypothetical protein